MKLLKIQNKVINLGAICAIFPHYTTTYNYGYNEQVEDGSEIYFGNVSDDSVIYFDIPYNELIEIIGNYTCIHEVAL